GYGIRLVWPDEPCARRGELILCRVANATSPHDYPQDNHCRFLNFTWMDFCLKEKRLTWRQFIERTSAGPLHSLSLHSQIVGEDAMLLAYYEQIIAPMCSTTRARNGFHDHIMPVVLSCRDGSATALCSSLLAISAYHHQGPGSALKYKISAIKGLHESLTASSSFGWNADAEAQLATTMMLCMYSVFDEQEAQFHLHLDGAKKILRSLQWHQQQRPVSDFLMNWVLYYDVLSSFAQPSRGIRGDLRMLSYSSNLQPTSNLIIGLFGCSTDVFSSISFMNQMRMTLSDSSVNSDPGEQSQQRVALEERLRMASQRLSPDEAANSSTVQIKDASATAELYRLAALLYLQRVVPAPGDDMRSAAYLQQIFAALRTVRVATSPWPVFITACEARTEHERVQILRVLERMDEIRNVGNVRVMRSLIESIWKQQDLRDSSGKSEAMQWWLCVDGEVPAPWFA
ncbi:hypothetical protein BN1708_006608, partial [Verticillium longisporum]